MMEMLNLARVVDVYSYTHGVRVGRMLELVYFTGVMGVCKLRVVLDPGRVMCSKLYQGVGRGQKADVDVVQKGEGGGHVDGQGAHLYWVVGGQNAVNEKPR